MFITPRNGQREIATPMGSAGNHLGGFEIVIWPAPEEDGFTEGEEPISQTWKEQ